MKDRIAYVLGATLGSQGTVYDLKGGKHLFWFEQTGQVANERIYRTEDDRKFSVTVVVREL